MKTSVVDMREQPIDAGSGVPDTGIVPRQDMARGEDMQMIEQDMPEEVDLPQDMPPRVCDELGDLERVAPGDTLRGDLVRGRQSSTDYAHCPSITPQLSRSFVLEIAEEVVIDIWTTHGETTVQNPVLLLEDGCEPLTEEHFIGCSQRSNNEEGRQASIRQRLVPGEYVLTIAEHTNQFFDADGGNYVVHVDTVEDFEPNGSCEDAEPLVPNTGYYNELATGTGDRGRTTSCFTGRNLLYYTLEVPPKHGVELGAAYTEPVRDILIRVDTSCERGPQSFCTQRRWVTAQSEVNWANETDTTQRYVIAVDVDQSLPFFIDNRIEPLATNAFCEDALPVASGTSSPSQPWIEAGPRTQICNTDKRRSFFYEITVPDQHRLHLPGTIASIHTGCGDVENQCVDQPYINRSGQSEDLILMTSLRGTSGETSQVTPVVVPLASNSSCDAPIALDPNGAPLTDQDIMGGGESIDECHIVSIYGLPTLYYSLAMPLGGPDYSVTVTADDPRHNGLISVQVLQRADDPAQCHTGACQAWSDAYFRGDAPAELVLTPDFGGGRDPIPTIIAVTMSTPWDMTTAPSFSIRAEPILP